MKKKLLLLLTVVALSSSLSGTEWIKEYHKGTRERNLELKIKQFTKIAKGDPADFYARKPKGLFKKSYGTYFLGQIVGLARKKKVKNDFRLTKFYFELVKHAAVSSSLEKKRKTFVQALTLLLSEYEKKFNKAHQEFLIYNRAAELFNTKAAQMEADLVRLNEKEKSKGLKRREKTHQKYLAEWVKNKRNIIRYCTVERDKARNSRNSIKQQMMTAINSWEQPMFKKERQGSDMYNKGQLLIAEARDDVINKLERTEKRGMSKKERRAASGKLKKVRK
jgi:hypothetical protein